MDDTDKINYVDEPTVWQADSGKMPNFLLYMHAHTGTYVCHFEKNAEEEGITCWRK